MKAVQREIVDSLASAAAGYAWAGVALVLGTHGRLCNAQAAIGNLAIATELLVKAFIAKQHLALLFRSLPKELRCALIAPARIPESFRVLPHEIALRSSVHKTLELDEAISVFSVFFPDFKKRYTSHLKFLSQHRNTCVHAAHPGCREYEAQRSAFLFLTLLKHIEAEDADLVRRCDWGDKEKNEAFLAAFNEARLTRVHKKVEAAAEKAKSLSNKVCLEPEEWEWYPVRCPVCGSDGLAYGETKAEADFDEDGCGTVTLSFLAETFECEQCGLELADYDEMKIAGVDTEDIDRSDEQDRWEEDHYSDYCYIDPW